MENDEDDDMGLQLALKKARKLKQLETLEKKPDLTELLMVNFDNFPLGNIFYKYCLISCFRKLNTMITHKVQLC